MSGKSDAHPAGGPIATLAARQHGVVGARQLYALGLSEDQVAQRARAGWLHRVHRGVYAVGHQRLTTRGHWLAGVLAVGEDALLSHHAAAALWGIRSPRGVLEIDVSVPRPGGRRARPGVVVHRIQTLLPIEATRRENIPVTTPARTILDLATVLPRRPLERAIDEAERLGLCGVAVLARTAAEHRGRAGAGALASLLGSHAIGSTVTRSELEERFLGLCRQRGLPVPSVNVPLLDYVVDFLWPSVRLIVEVDGRASHGTRRAFQQDRDRDSRLAAHGYRTLRFTWWDVTSRPAVVAERVRRVLSAAVA